jgi:hypothetical protein
MAINKPNIPSAELPEDWGGTQTPYTEQQTREGYPEAIPTVIDGGNLNYEKRGIFQHIKYFKVFADWLRNIPIGKIPVVNNQGQLDYDDPVTDSEVVHKTGDETISGTKTFTKDIVRNASLDGAGAYAVKTVDSNGKGVTSLISYYTGNTMYNRMLTENITAGKNAYFDVQMKDDGTASIGFNGSATERYVNLHGATKVRVPTPSSSAEGGEAVNISYLKSVMPTITYWD